MIETIHYYDQADVTALMFAMKDCYDERDVDLVGPPELAKIHLVADDAARYLAAVLEVQIATWDGVVWYERLAEGRLAEQLFVRSVLGREPVLAVILSEAKVQDWKLKEMFRGLGHGH